MHSRDLPPDVRQQLAHEPRSLISALHLLLLELLHVPRDGRVEGDRHDHDSDADERRPSKDVVQRYKRQDDLPKEI